jgi:hypothetical protein
LATQRLRNVDLYRYDDAWERKAVDALADFFTIQPADGEYSVLSLAAGGSTELDKYLVARQNTQVLDFPTRSIFLLTL